MELGDYGFCMNSAGWSYRLFLLLFMSYFMNQQTILEFSGIQYIFLAANKMHGLGRDLEVS